MNNFTATFDDGETWTRNSKRAFTHCVRMKDALWGNRPVVNWASSLDLAHKKGESETGPEAAHQSYEVAECTAT